MEFANKLKGLIVLQVEDNGEAYYIYPNDSKKYYLGRPADAFSVMRKLGLGATHEFITSNTTFPDNVLGKILLDPMAVAILSFPNVCLVLYFITIGIGVSELSSIKLVKLLCK